MLNINQCRKVKLSRERMLFKKKADILRDGSHKFCTSDAEHAFCEEWHDQLLNLINHLENNNIRGCTFVIESMTGMMHRVENNVRLFGYLALWMMDIMNKTTQYLKLIPA